MQAIIPIARYGLKRAIQWGGSRAAKRLAVGAGAAASGYHAYKKWTGADSTNSTSTPAGTATSGFANVATKRRSKTRLTRRGRRLRSRRRRRYRRFKQKVYRVMRGQQKMSWYQDTATAVPASISGFSSAGVSAFNTTANLTTLSDGRQYIMGASEMYTIFGGPKWGTTRGLGYIQSEAGQFTQDINGATVTNTGLSRTALKMWFPKVRLELTIENNSKFLAPVSGPPAVDGYTPQDVTCDIYEYVAQQNISDASYRTVKDTIYTLLGSSLTVANVPTTDSSIPTNMFSIKGTTPFSVRDLGRWWKCIGKTRVSVPFNSDQGIYPYQKLTYSVKKKLVDFSKCQDHYAMKGITRSLLIIFEPDLTSDKLLSTPTGALDVPYCNVWAHKDWHFKPINGSMTATSISLPNILQSTVAGSIN